MGEINRWLTQVLSPGYPHVDNPVQDGDRIVIAVFIVTIILMSLIYWKD